MTILMDTFLRASHIQSRGQNISPITIARGASTIALIAGIFFLFRLGWVNCALGTGTFASPWIFSYTGETGRLINSLVVGVVVFIVAVRSATAIGGYQDSCHRKEHY